jgi:hypothetical protein
MLPPTVAPQNNVAASDQFLNPAIPVYLDSLTRLVNWVSKNGSTVKDTLIHYTWWNIINKNLVEKPVVITNQFGSGPAQVHDLEFMLVPAWKNYQAPNFPQANHYLCYRADSPIVPPSGFYDLFDEWRHDGQYVGPLQYLCAPCTKYHGGVVFPPVDTLTHLAVYPIYPQSDYFYPLVSDQFLTRYQYVQQYAIEYLFVPTVKTEVNTPTRHSSWGKLKSLYK